MIYDFIPFFFEFVFRYNNYAFQHWFAEQIMLKSF